MYLSIVELTIIAGSGLPGASARVEAITWEEFPAPAGFISQICISYLFFVKEYCKTKQRT